VMVRPWHERDKLEGDVVQWWGHGTRGISLRVMLCDGGAMAREG
jgi:hypothetical protein